MKGKCSYEETKEIWGRLAREDMIDIYNRNQNRHWDMYEKLLALKAARLSGGKILDMGCGTGRITGFLLENGFNDITSADYCEEALAKTRRIYPGVRTITADITDMSFIDETFDCIILVRVLQSLPTDHMKEKAMIQMRGLLRPGGIVCIVEGNPMRMTTISCNFYMGYSRWKAMFRRMGFVIGFSDSIPVSTVLEKIDRLMGSPLRRKALALFDMTYFVDRFIGRVYPGFLSHIFSFILENGRGNAEHEKEIRMVSEL